MTDNKDDYSNPLARKSPLGGRTGVAIASIVPLVSLALFIIFGFAIGWGYSWLFFLLIPISGIIVYGLRGNSRN
ncbi:hypothetical protein [Microbacterium sp. 179-I 3D3 NHS]|uniref:hypothetical protein n=1 Tax=Microbacterium sp. 179-I 3D3 NHS TaxID=3142382 RepID=UPI0039A235CB